MNYEQYLLIKLAEEASEVAKDALKAAQFGLEEVHPSTGVSNVTRLAEELCDMGFIIAKLDERLLAQGKEPLLDIVDAVESDAYFNTKSARFEKYLAYSRELGKVEASTE